MIHPFALAIEDLEILTAEGLSAEAVDPSVDHFADHVVGGLSLAAPTRLSHETGICPTPPVLTKAWQEGGEVTTLALGEEGGCVPPITKPAREAGGSPHPISRPWSEIGAITQSCLETGC